MAMTYTSLTGSKGTAGAVATWVNYTLLDVPTVVDEAQTLIFQTLRVREMRASATLSLSIGQNAAALPGASAGNFLEPLVLRDNVSGTTLIPNDERFVSQEKLAELRVYTGAVLASGTPGYVAIFDESFQFDVQAAAAWSATLIFYQRPALLSSGNQSNWLTNRYPHIMRAACMAAAADFMKDTDEYTKAFTRLQQLIEVANKESAATALTGVSAGVNNKPEVEGSLLSFLNPTTVPVQAILAEAQSLIFSKLRTREMRTSASLTLAAGQSLVALPNAANGQFLEPISLHDDTNAATMIPNDNAFVTEKRLLQLRQYTGGVLNSGVPAHVAIFDESFQFDVKAAAQTNYTLVYYLRPANLTNRTQTSWLTQRYPQLLRTAAQAALADFNRDGAAHTEALTRLDALIAAANAETALIDSRGSALNTDVVEGSLLSFLSETTVPVQAVLTEAQQLLYGMLRCREMMADYPFSLSIGSSYFALPSNFLDPVGRITFASINRPAMHKDSNFVQQARMYNETAGTLGTNPFTTVSGSNLVTVALTAHNFAQDGIFNTAGATAFNGVTIVGTFPIASIVDANNFVIDITSLGTTPTGSGSGGGAAATYTCDSLVPGLPNWFGIWNERVNFDTSAVQQLQGLLQYYRSLPLLTSPKQSNFLTTRYPQLFRIACQAAEANLRRDRAAYAAVMAALGPMVTAVNVENEGQYRGLELDPQIP